MFFNVSGLLRFILPSEGLVCKLNHFQGSFALLDIQLKFPRCTLKTSVHNCSLNIHRPSFLFLPPEKEKNHTRFFKKGKSFLFWTLNFLMFSGRLKKWCYSVCRTILGKETHNLRKGFLLLSGNVLDLNILDIGVLWMRTAWLSKGLEQLLGAPTMV